MRNETEPKQSPTKLKIARLVCRTLLYMPFAVALAAIFYGITAEFFFRLMAFLFG